MICTRSAPAGAPLRLSTAAFSPHGARMAMCPDCEYDELDVEDMEEGDQLSCPECGKRLSKSGDDEVELADDEDDDDDDLDDEEEEEDLDEDEDDEDEEDE